MQRETKVDCTYRARPERGSAMNTALPSSGNAVRSHDVILIYTCVGSLGMLSDHMM